MSKIFKICLMICCLILAACRYNEEPAREAVSPLEFEKTDYTIMYGRGASIPFSGGGGVYSYEASDPEVLGKFGIDIETHRLLINPAKTGESSLKITDVNAESSVTLYITVEDFYVPFKILEIDGTNDNMYLEVGVDIRFIRDEDNTKAIKIIRNDSSTDHLETLAEGYFDISMESKEFRMVLSLHAPNEENLETFEYTMGGNSECLSMFDQLFGFNWVKWDETTRSPSPAYRMSLTDISNGCKITCQIQNWNPY